MKLLKLTEYALNQVKPTIFKNKNNITYFNIVLGNRDIHGFRYGIRLDKIMFDPEINPDVVLDKDNYTIRPYIKDVDGNKLVYKDRQDNTVYVLSKDNDISNTKDILLIWDIPNNMYKDITFTTNGDVNVLACAYNAKTRGTAYYKSPVLLLEIYGDCELQWKGYNSKQETIEQTVSYKQKSNEWDIGLVKVLK